jgi:hypothetical protein
MHILLAKIENLGEATALLFLRGSTTDRKTHSEVTIIRLKIYCSIREEF